MLKHSNSKAVAKKVRLEIFSMNFLIVLCIIFIFVESLYASELFVAGESLGFLDNLEYTHGSGNSGTFFGNMNRLGLEYNINKKNRLYGGIFYLHNFGSEISYERILPLIYYRYSSEKRFFFFGTTVRSSLLGNYPRFLIGDDFSYAKPLFEGFLLQRKFEYFRMNIWSDWIGMQTPLVHEEFLLGSDISVNIRKFRMTVNYVYNHIASRSNMHDPVRDESGLVTGVGFFSGRVWILDSLVAHAEFLFSATRDRGITMEYRTPLGFKTGAKVLFNKFGLSYFHYATILENYYGKHKLSKGEAVYGNSSFDQIDLFVIPIKNKFVQMSFNLSLISVGGGMDHRENFELKVPLKKRLKRFSRTKSNTK